ncbi:hypothetical protein D3C84_842250 [compost metagenome]
MNNDLIDDSGFELGLAEMLQGYNRLLEAELETTRSELQRAHKTIAGLIVMYGDSSKELTALKLEHEHLRWKLSDMYRCESEREVKTMGYAYGYYSTH